MPLANPAADYLSDAMLLAKSDLPGWAFAVIRSELLDREIVAAGESRAEIEPTSKAIIPSSGPVGAPVAFVGASPSVVDAARGEPFTGPLGQTLKSMYLPQLELERGDVVLTNAVPILLTDDSGARRSPSDSEVDEWREWIAKELDRLGPRVVVALGQTAKTALGDRADFVLPHPGRVRHGRAGTARSGSAVGQLNRKLPRIAKAAQPPPREVQIVKANDEKQIVYGIVLSSYGADGTATDAHNDYISPAEIEQTSHEWFKGPSRIGISHPGQPGYTTDVGARPVESHIERYPTLEDYKRAQAGEPHNVTRSKFGSDVVYSGDWILGTELDDGPWADYRAGKWNAYSIEGLGMKRPAAPSVMPAVTFVDPEPAGS